MKFSALALLLLPLTGWSQSVGHLAIPLGGIPIYSASGELDLVVAPADAPETPWPVVWEAWRDTPYAPAAFDGWRVPTREEWRLMCAFRDRIPGLEGYLYWTDEAADEHYAYAQYLPNDPATGCTLEGPEVHHRKHAAAVRLVRSPE